LAVAAAASAVAAVGPVPVPLQVAAELLPPQPQAPVEPLRLRPQAVVDLPVPAQLPVVAALRVRVRRPVEAAVLEVSVAVELRPSRRSFLAAMARNTM
jgi:hypothetical protein